MALKYKVSEKVSPIATNWFVINNAIALTRHKHISFHPKHYIKYDARRLCVETTNLLGCVSVALAFLFL